MKSKFKTVNQSNPAYFPDLLLHTLKVKQGLSFLNPLAIRRQRRECNHYTKTIYCRKKTINALQIAPRTETPHQRAPHCAAHETPHNDFSTNSNFVPKSNKKRYFLLRSRPCLLHINIHSGTSRFFESPSFLVYLAPPIVIWLATSFFSVVFAAAL